MVGRIMKAAVRRKYGSPDVIEVLEIEPPKISKKEVLVKVHATTVSRTDCGILTGKPYIIRLFIGLFSPRLKVLGTDFAGEIVAVGDKVLNFKIGDRVWGLNDECLSSQAQYLKIDASKAIIKIPGDTSYKEIVACAEGAHYAYNFIRKVNMEKGNRVLVNGASGAIGSALVQLLKHFGCKVTAVTNTKNVDLAHSLGAEKVFDYLKEDFVESANNYCASEGKFHFIFDAVGKSDFSKCKQLLLAKGIYMSSELGPGAENLYLPLITKLKGGKRVVFPLPINTKRSLNFLSELVERREFKAVIDKEYSIDDIQKAYEYVLTEEKTGNVLINY